MVRDHISDQIPQQPQQPPVSSKCPYGFPQIKVTTSPLKRSQLNQLPFKVPGVSPTPRRPWQEFDSSTSSTSGRPWLWDTILLASMGLVETPSPRAHPHGTGSRGSLHISPPKGKFGTSSSTPNPISPIHRTITYICRSMNGWFFVVNVGKYTIPLDGMGRILTEYHPPKCTSWIWTTLNTCKTINRGVQKYIKVFFWKTSFW